MVLHVCLRELKSLTRLAAPLHFDSRYGGMFGNRGRPAYNAFSPGCVKLWKKFSL